jgi:hypothetical protein
MTPLTVTGYVIKQLKRRQKNRERLQESLLKRLQQKMFKRLLRSAQKAPATTTAEVATRRRWLDDCKPKSTSLKDPRIATKKRVSEKRVTHILMTNNQRNGTKTVVHSDAQVQVTITNDYGNVEQFKKGNFDWYRQKQQHQ